MKKITRLCMMAGLLWAGQSQAQIFISEYAEGTAGNNKYIEIANGGSSSVSLDDYMLVNNSNAPDAGKAFDYDNSYMIAGVTLGPGEVYVIANEAADSPVLSKADTSFQYVSFNGDDWWAILKASDSSVVDEIGTSAADPGSGWDVAGVTAGTKDHTLIRKPGIYQGNTWGNSAGTDAASSEWIVLDGPDASTVYGNPGEHTFKNVRMVKFSVDMTNETVSSNGVHVAGNFQGWSPSATTMTDDGNGIYTVYAEVDADAVVEYKFINNNDWSSGVESVPSISQKGHTNNGETNDNRWFYSGSGSDTLMLPAFVFSGSAPSGQYALRLAVDLKSEASVSADGVHVAGSIQGWDPSKDMMANLYSTNKIYEIIFCLEDNSYEYKFVNGNAWGSDEAVPSACATNNNRGVTISGADVEQDVVCFGSCEACPGAPLAKYKVTFQVDMGNECDVDDVDIAGGKINGWSGGTMLSSTSGLSGDWKITKIGVGPSKGDISWFSEDINENTRACMMDDRVVLNRDGSFFNIFGSETWIEGWQVSGANGCGTPVAPHDGAMAGSWKDNGDGTFTVYGKGSHLGIPKVINGAEISDVNNAPDSITYEYDLTGSSYDSALTVYISIGGGYWQFNYERANPKASVWSVTVELDSGVEIAHKMRKITSVNGEDIVSWEGGSDRKIFAHNDTTLEARCFGKDEPCSGTPLAPVNITFTVDLSQEIPADTVWVMGSFTLPAWQAGALALTQDATNTDFYSTTVENVCPDYIEFKFANETMNSSTNGETFDDSTDRSCVIDNGIGGWNRAITRTDDQDITVEYIYNTCRPAGSANTTDLSTEMSIAPNPANGIFTVKLAGSKINTVEILSIDGRTIRSYNANSISTSIDATGLNGIFLVKVSDNIGRTAIKKIVLQ